MRPDAIKSGMPAIPEGTRKTGNGVTNAWGRQNDVRGKTTRQVRDPRRDRTWGLCRRLPISFHIHLTCTPFPITLQSTYTVTSLLNKTCILFSSFEEIKFSETCTLFTFLQQKKCPQFRGGTNLFISSPLIRGRWDGCIRRCVRGCWCNRRCWSDGWCIGGRWCVCWRWSIGR